MSVYGWRRGHLAHGDLLGPLAGPVSKPAGRGSRALCCRPTDGHAGSGDGQLHPTGRAPSSPHPRITSPGLRWRGNGVSMWWGQRGGDKFCEKTRFPSPSGEGQGEGYIPVVAGNSPLIRASGTFSLGRRKGGHSGDKSGSARSRFGSGGARSVPAPSARSSTSAPQPTVIPRSRQSRDPGDLSQSVDGEAQVPRMPASQAPWDDGEIGASITFQRPRSSSGLGGTAHSSSHKSNQCGLRASIRLTFHWRGHFLIRFSR